MICQLVGLSRLLAAPPPRYAFISCVFFSHFFFLSLFFFRNADVEALSDLVVCMAWTGEEAREALTLSGVEQRVAGAAERCLHFQVRIDWV
jgi:hypothetical protein